MKYLILIISFVFAFAYAECDKTKCSKNITTEETKMACKEAKGECCKAMEAGKCFKHKCGNEEADVVTIEHKCDADKCGGDVAKEAVKEIKNN